METEPIQTDAVHTHSDDCYGTERGALVCQLTETEGHSHGQSCFTQGALVCQMTETEGHTHGTACYGMEQGVLICQLTETEGHTHGTACYESLLTCELSEEPAHQHTDACYEMLSVLICGQEDGAILTESTDTTEPERELICTEPVAQVHTHGDSCYVSTEEDPLTCTLPEDENHTHSAICYGTWELICGKEEHTHDLVCQNDPEADVETEADWIATLADVTLTGEWDEDLLSIARSQLGYQESTRNYEVMEDGETIKGYTRYGDWYGMPYGDWCAMFVSFCLNYADIHQAAVPYEANCPAWIEALQDEEYALYRLAGEYTPVPGDLIFFDWEEDGTADHVGIVTEIIPATEEEPAKIKTIEGNTGDRVAQQEYELDDVLILGYAQLPEKPDEYYCGFQEHSHDASCVDENGELICGLDEHTHDEACIDYIGALIVKIDTLPTSEEAEAVLVAYEETEDWNGYETYQQKISDIAWPLYYACEELTEDELAQVTNYDKLMDLQWLWSASIYKNNPLPDGIDYSGVTYNPEYTPGYLGSAYAGDDYHRAMTEAEYGTWAKLAVTHQQDSSSILHINEPVPDEYTIDGLVIGAKSFDSFTISDAFRERVRFHKALTTQEEKDQLYAETGYSWDAVAAAGLNRCYGSNLILPATTTEKNALLYNSDTCSGSKHDHVLGCYNIYVIYKNIGTYKGKTIDLRMTLTEYENYIYQNQNDNWKVRTGVLGFRNLEHDGSKHPGIAVCGLAWVKIRYDFYDAATGKYTDVVGSSSFFDVDYGQAIHLNMDPGPDGKLRGVYITSRTTDVPDIPAVRAMSTEAAQISYFRNWHVDDCVLKYSAEAPSNRKGVYIYSPHGNDQGDGSEQYGDTKHAFTYTFAGNHMNYIFSFDKGLYACNSASTADELNYKRNANGGILHAAVPVYTGSLEIKKEATATDIYPDKEFEFQIEFYKKAGGTVPDDHLDGTFGGVNLQDGVGTFKLKSGESVKITGIPIRTAGTSYKITELTTDGYIVTTSMTQDRTGSPVENQGPYTQNYFNGTLQADDVMQKIQTVTFKNRYNSISVEKVLTCTNAEIEMVGDPYFSFQIMKAGTTTPLFGNGDAGAGYDYYVYDVQTGELVGENPRQTEAYGIFKIKAGQRAEFKEINQYTGKYYIREVLYPTFYSQYEGIYVDGVKVTQTVSIFNGTYIGVVSEEKDFSDEDTTFTFTNHVNAEKISYLTITKMVAGDAPDGIDFDMEVLLNGEPIPVGTPYTLYKTSEFMASGERVEIESNPHRTVTTAGIVTVPGGATAQIDCIIPGTTFRISETTDSAEGYTVKYDEYWGTDWIEVDNTNGYISGTVPIYIETDTDKTGSHSCVVVTNTKNPNSVSIPVTKMLTNGNLDPNTTHTYSFTIELVNINGNDPSHYNVSYENTKEVQVTGANHVAFDFTVTYADSSFTGTSTLLYKITENKPDALESTHDPAEYYATVLVEYSQSSKKITNVKLTSLTKDGKEVTSATFTNNLLGELSLTKQLDGVTDANRDKEFSFTVKLTPQSSVSLSTVQLPSGVTTDDNSLIHLTLKHGQTVTIQGIPLGTTWQVQETSYDGYLVSWESPSGSGAEDAANGLLTAGGAQVTFTNKVKYELPETGGGGTVSYTMAGLALICIGAVYLLYSYALRRRRDVSSP